MTIGENLYNLRKGLNLSQEEVANKLNVSRQTVSKWETDQSMPDFDKIVPLCELYKISADELLNVKTFQNKEISDYNEDKKKTALIKTISVSLYFLSIIFVIMATEIFRFSDGIIVCGFLSICMLATALLTYHFTSMPKRNNRKVIEKKMENKIISIIAILTTIIYLTVSFLTMAWHITWIIWLIFALIRKIISLVFEIMEDKYGK